MLCGEYSQRELITVQKETDVELGDLGYFNKRTILKDVGLCGETTSKGVQYSQTRNAGHLLERFASNSGDMKGIGASQII